MLRGRSFRRLALGFAIAVSISAINPTPASALSMSVPSTILYGICSGSIAWRGDIPNDNAAHTQYEQSKGSVKFCATFYRVSDSDPTGDYYAVGTQAFWTTTLGSNHYPPDAYGNVQISSSIAAVNNYSFVSPDKSITLNTSCSSDYSIGFNVGVFGGSVTQRFCSGGKLNLESATTKVGRWASPDVTKTPKWETMYMLKVANGAKPLLTTSLKIPRYNIYRDPTTLYWKYTKAWTAQTYSWQTR